MTTLSYRPLIVAGALGLGAIGCSGSGSPGTVGKGLDIRVAPLDLPLMTDACYSLTVYRQTEDFDEDDVVWTQPELCASQYGAEGGIRFTGICDPTGPGGQNAVRLVLDEVYRDGDAGSGTALTPGEDYINPCPPAAVDEDNGCVLLADCEPSQDTKIEFNLTVMRNAELGFFDTVVKFHDVFCSAKLDCVQNDGTTTLTYLHDPGTGEDGPTAVLGFTCLGGDGNDVSMYLDDLVIECGTGSGETYTVTRTATVDPGAGPGNLSSPALSHTGPSSPLFGAAVNTGAGFQGARYWNVLLGLELDGVAGEVCRLTTRGTVSEGALSANTTPAHNRYPYIDWNLVLSTGSSRTCTRHPLDAASGVTTEYTGIDAPETFDNVLALQATCPCWDLDTLAQAVDDRIAAGDYDYYWDIGQGEVGFDLGGDGGWVSVELEDNECAASIEDVQTHVSGLGAAQIAACEADLASVMDNPCATGNGGCSGTAPHCEYTGIGDSRCTECLTNAECSSPNVCDTSGYYGNPETQHMCVECSGPLFACPVGEWCDGSGTCAVPGTWYDVGVASYGLPDNAAAAAACAAVGRRLPTMWELTAAMTAQFVYGTEIPGVVFLPNQYYGVPWPDPDTGSVAVWAWDGSQVGGPWNGDWANGMRAVCVP